MTPPCPVFKADALETAIQTDLSGKKRKGGDVDLSKCELLGMLQYDCQVDEPHRPGSKVLCFPTPRWFRRCQDGRGHRFMVETTKWESRETKRKAAGGGQAAQAA